MTAATSALLWEATFDDDEYVAEEGCSLVGDDAEEGQDHEAPSPPPAGLPASDLIEESGVVPVPAVHDDPQHVKDATQEEAASMQASGSGAMTRRPRSLSPDQEEKEARGQEGQQPDEEPRGVYLTEQRK